MDGFLDGRDRDERTPDDDARLIEFVVGGLSDAERVATAQWIAADPARQAYVQQLRETWDTVPARASGQYDVDAALVSAKARITGNAGRVAPRRAPLGSHIYTSRRTIWVSAIACGVALVAIAGAVLAPRIGSRRAVRTSNTYATAVGQQATVVLQDGSRVQLAPRTTLHVDEAFGTGTRTVTLSGEAYFDVRHAVGGAFIVKTGTVSTRVLGTTFGVRHDAADSAVHVVVTTGRVAVAGGSTRRTPLTLSAGMIGIVTDSSAVTTSTTESPYVGWINGQLVFHKAPTADVLASLTRWYGYQFRLADSSLARQNLTLALSTESSSAALSTLKLMLDVDLTFDHNIVTLRPRVAGHATPRLTPRQHDTLFPTSLEVGR